MTDSALDLIILGTLGKLNEPVDMRTLARAVDATPEAIRHHVLKLHKLGLIARTGGKRGPSVRYAPTTISPRED